jgi:hypothetical protein
MASISQKIPSFIGGISQQPQERQPLGTVKDALNTVPDVKGILSKRPGSRLVGTLSDDTEGVWHHYFRDNNEQYFMRVRRDGQVDVWDAMNGTPRLVMYNKTPVDLGTVESNNPHDDAKPICDTCDPDAFRTATDDLQAATVALQDVENRIEEINVIIQTTPEISEEELNLLMQEKADLKATVPDLLTDYANAQTEYALVASSCGVFNNPYSRDLKAAPCDPNNLIEYLEHNDDEQLQFTTINDYTYVTNRSTQVLMNAGVGKDEDKYEAFLYLNSLAYERIYAVNYWDADSSNNTVTEKKQASSLKYKPSRYGGSQALGFNRVDKTFTNATYGITYRAVETRQDILEAVPDKGDDYDAQWTLELYFISADPSIESKIDDSWTIGPNEGYDKTWTITVDKDTNYTTSADATITAGPYTVDSGVISSNVILQDLSTEFKDKGIDVEILGNGIYLTSDTPFAIDTPDRDLITTFGDKINNVALLPDQCKDGYVVQVVNSFLEQDDYWVKFKAYELVENSDISVGNASGYWEETVDPASSVAFDPNTMPHQIRRLSDGTFEVSPIQWAEREVGKEDPATDPSFIKSKINKILFFRNRLTFLSDENIIMSRPNEFYNFWINTAKTVTDGDPIDLRCSSTTPAILYDGIESAAGLILFSDNEQFIMVTDNTDIFSPLTASVKSVGTYRYNKKVKPVHMGQTIGFLNDAGYRSRFFELVPDRDYDYAAVETSKPVDQLISSGITEIATSRDNSMVALAVKEAEDHLVWIYRYFENGERRVQSSWFRWKVSGKLLYHAIMKDKYYVVMKVPTGADGAGEAVTLESFDLKLDSQSLLVRIEGDTMLDYDYQIHLDSYEMITDATTVYDATTKKTSWRVPLGFNGTLPIACYELMITNDGTGYVATGRYLPDLEKTYLTNGIIVSAPGDWTGINILCGYNFDYEVLLPTMYVQKPNGNNGTVADISGSLVLHRINLTFEATGVCDITVDRKGREPYTVGYESTIQDGYIANDSAIMMNLERVIPIYDRNTNTEIRLKSTHPTPTNLISATWEGDYNQRYYKRV